MSRPDRKELKAAAHALGRQAFEEGRNAQSPSSLGFAESEAWRRGWEEARNDARIAALAARDQDARDEWRAMSTEQRFDYLFTTIERLKARIETLEEGE